MQNLTLPLSLPLVPPKLLLNRKCFPSMKDKGAWIGVAFRKGSLSTWFDDMIMVGTLGSFVHCELLLGQDHYADAYSSYCDQETNLGFTRSREDFNNKHWVVLSFPLSDAKKAQALSLSLLDNPIPYNYKDLWQCCLGVALPFEQEIDCTNMEHWKKGVFCSQMCLLFMRNLHLNDSLKLNHQGYEYNLKHIHSRGCSPNFLYGFLSHFCNKVVF